MAVIRMADGRMLHPTGNLAGTPGNGTTPGNANHIALRDASRSGTLCNAGADAG